MAMVPLNMPCANCLLQFLQRCFIFNSSCVAWSTIRPLLQEWRQLTQAISALAGCGAVVATLNRACRLYFVYFFCSMPTFLTSGKFLLFIHPSFVQTTA